MNRLAQLLEERQRLVIEMRGIVEKARAENRDVTQEEQEKYDRLFTEQGNKAKTIEAEQRQAELDRALATAAAPTEKPELRNAIRDSLFPAHRRTVEYQEAFRHFLISGEKRALSVGLDTAGGFIVAPEQFVATLIKAVDDVVFIRQQATKFTVAAAVSLGAASLDADPADGDWTSEIATGNEDTAMAFGKRDLHPHPLAKRIKVSNKLLNMAPNAEGLVLNRLSYKFGVSQEKGFLLGNGNQQPLGVFVASNDGIPTSRDVSTDNTTTAVTMNGLINAKYALKSAYQRTASWMFHRDGVKQVAKLRDESGGAGTGQYLWEPSKKVGEPDMLLGVPLIMSEYVPNTFTTGLYVGIIGDFSWYWIADSISMQMQRLSELYAETNQTGFIGRLETDGMPVLAEAFVRVKLA